VRVFFWAADGGGCAWYRMHCPAAALAMLGYATHASQTLDSRWVDADVVVGQRICNPAAEGANRRWRQLAADGRRLVWDADDDYLSTDPDSPDPGQRFFARPEVRRLLLETMALASTVTVATPALAEVYGQHHGDVRVVPNALPGYLLDRQPPATPGKLVVGWAGSLATAAELPLVARHLNDLLDRCSDPYYQPAVELHLLGVDRRHLADLKLPHASPRMRVTPWVAGTPAYLDAVDFDIWVAPYRDTPFNRAKVPTKALEAAALGVPIVASAMGAYRTHVRHGQTGFLVRRDHEWAQYLWRLVTDPQLRARMSTAARIQAAEHTLTATGPLWARAVCGGAP
jgi:glycosyltransferase involved in cell wall biosynthesis